MTKQIMGAFIGTTAVGLLFLLGTKIIGPIPLSISQTTTNKQSSFDAVGEGKVTASPDRAQVDLGLTQTDVSVSSVQDKGNSVIQKITNDLASIGISQSDIKTINYGLNPTYNFQTGTQQITGYSLNVTLEVQVKDFTKINQAVDTATKDGANQVGGISFTLSDEKQQQLQNQARQIAITQAKQRADDLSRLAGVKLGRIINITENDGPSYNPRPMMPLGVAMDAKSAAPVTPTDVSPGSTSVSVSVTLSYEL